MAVCLFPSWINILGSYQKVASWNPAPVGGLISRLIICCCALGAGCPERCSRLRELHLTLNCCLQLAPSIWDCTVLKMSRKNSKKNPRKQHKKTINFNYVWGIKLTTFIPSNVKAELLMWDYASLSWPKWQMIIFMQKERSLLVLIQPMNFLMDFETARALTNNGWLTLFTSLIPTWH